MCVCVCMCVCDLSYIYIYIERERERESIFAFNRLIKFEKLFAIASDPFKYESFDFCI